MSVTQHARKAAANEPAAKARAREAGLLEAAFNQHQAELLGTLYYLVGNLEDARDALQEAFIKCWRHQEEIGQVRNLKAWIFRVALNTGRDLRSSAWRRRREPLADAELSAAHHSPAGELVHAEEVTRVRIAVMDLRPEEQEVFLLRQNGELTYEEIARTLDIPVNTAKTRMRLALSKLRTALGPD